MTERGVAVMQASRDPDVTESVFRRWVREANAVPATVFPGNGLQRADLAEITALKNEAVT